MEKILILSDGKPGHVNQSRAFAELSGLDYTAVEVQFRNRLCKGLSYLFDKIGFYTSILFSVSGNVENCSAVVSAGSNTYCANRVLASRLGARSISVMLPRGYRYKGFDLIIGQEHDHPPVRDNIQAFPINLCHVKPQNVFKSRPEKRYIGLVIGGSNKVFKMKTETIQQQVEQIFNSFPDHKILVATSRRTPADVDALLKPFSFSESWIYSDDPTNPIPDFLEHCDYVFITGDSTSMISEAVSFGKSAVEILPLVSTGQTNKFTELTSGLERRGCLHIFYGSIGECRTKIDLKKDLKGMFK